MRRMRFAYLLVALCLSAGLSLLDFQSYSTQFVNQPVHVLAAEPAQEMAPGDPPILQPDLPEPVLLDHFSDFALLAPELKEVDLPTLHK